MNPIKGKVRAIKDNVLIAEMNFGEQKTKSGLVLLSDDGKTHGVKPRWGKVWAIGPEQKDVNIGDWILVEHGRWTRGLTIEDENGEEITIRRVDNNAILIKSEEQPTDVYIGAE